MPSEPRRAAVALPEAGRRTAKSASGPEPRAKSVVREYGEALFVALLLALFIRSFIVQAFKIPSGSMIPTLQIGDHILVNKFVYGVRVPYFGKLIVPVSKPRRGDVVVFIYPQDEDKDFIKREDGRTVAPRDNFGPFKVPAGYIFVMGDNRDRSYDSRFWGPVALDKVKGKAFLIYWSWDGSGRWARWERIGQLI